MFENDPVSGRRKSRSPSDSNEGFDKFFRCYRTLIRVIWLQLGFRWQLVLNFSRELYARLKICAHLIAAETRVSISFEFSWFWRMIFLTSGDIGTFWTFDGRILLQYPPVKFIATTKFNCWQISEAMYDLHVASVEWHQTWRNIRTTCIVITFTLASRSSRLNQAPPPTQRAQRAN